MAHRTVVDRPDSDEWISIQEASELTGFTINTLRVYVRQQNAPDTVRYRGRLLVKRDEAISKWGLRGD